MPKDIVDDIKNSLKHPGQLAYYQITPARSKTVAKKFHQLEESGVTLLIGTDSGIPMKFHSSSTWHELDAWVNKLGVDPDDHDSRRDLLARRDDESGQGLRLSERRKIRRHHRGERAMCCATSICCSAST